MVGRKPGGLSQIREGEAAKWGGASPGKKTPHPVASSNGCRYLCVAAVLGPAGSRGPAGSGRRRTVEAFCLDRAEVGDLPLAQLQSLQFGPGQLRPDLGAVGE